MHAMAIAQAAKVDRKLYIGNLPTGITPSTVINNISNYIRKKIMK
jgi:hypothetical protein